MEHGVPAERIIIRHGTEKLEGLTDVLTEELHELVAEAFSFPTSYLQSDDPVWMGGYFDMPGLTQAEHDAGSRADEGLKNHWRSEYLPGPVEAVAAAFCSAIGGLLGAHTDPNTRLRVTLHRTLQVGNEVVLQQCCDYQGVGVSAEGRAGRTFPSANGTIGAAFKLGTAVRTRLGATRADLEEDMRVLSLNEASKNMAVDVSSVAAIPLVEAPTSDVAGVPGSREGSPSVVGVLYLDSYEPDAFMDETTMGQVTNMCSAFLKVAPTLAESSSERIANTEFWRAGHLTMNSAHVVDPTVWRALECMPALTPDPGRLPRINFDFSDFTPVEQR
jgi:hypothetical protein